MVKNGRRPTLRQFVVDFYLVQFILVSVFVMLFAISFSVLVLVFNFLSVLVVGLLKKEIVLTSVVVFVVLVGGTLTAALS